MHASLERLRKRREEEGDEGFTLIELLIVIVILGILAAIVVFAVQNLTSSSSQASCGSDYKTVETAVEAYKAQIGSYPQDPGFLAAPTWTVTAGAVPGAYTTAGGDGSTMGDLLGTATSTGSTSPIGPWLKDVPQNPGHYLITVAPPTAAGGNATVSVIPAGTAANPCSAAT